MRAYGLLLAAAMVSHGGAALAAPTARPGLNWVRLPGAETCIAAPQLARGVEQRIGRPAFTSTHKATMFIDGRVWRDEDGWRVALELSDAQGVVLGRRELTFAGDDCSVIDAPVALVVAVTLYSGADLTQPGIALEPSVRATLDALFDQEPGELEAESLPATAPSAAGSAPDGPAPLTPPQRVPPVTPTPIAARPPDLATPSWAFDAGAAAIAGATPRLGWGVGLHVLLHDAWPWPLEVGVALTVPETFGSGIARPWGTLAGQTRFDYVAGSLRLCPLGVGAGPVLAVCAGADVGRVRVQAQFAGLDNHAARSDLWLSAAVGATLRLTLVGSLFMRVAAELGVPITHASYRIDTGAARPEVFATWPIGVRAETGLGAYF